MKPPAEMAPTDTPPGKGADADPRPEAVAGTLGLSAQQLALMQLRRHLTDWMRHEPGARLGTDPEELHQLRVVVRRIEATLSLFRHQLPSRLVETRKGAKGVLRALGSVRDLDVQLAELRQYCAGLHAAERGAALPLRSRLEEERARARARMVGVLDSEATRRWLEALNLASADCTAAAAPGAPLAATVMPDRVRGRCRKLKKAVRKLGAKSHPEEYHAVRRQAKRLRYAIECGTTFFGKPAEEMLKALRHLQDRLGAQQDAHMAKGRLAALAADSAPLPSETLFLMGRLAEWHLAQTPHARKTLARAWRRVSGKRWKSLRARMQELSDGVAAVQPALPTPAQALGGSVGGESSAAAAVGPRVLRH